MSRLPLRLGVVYDFRNPPDSGIPTPRLYAEILEQVAWLDTLGLDLVWFTEHHFVDDGYLPSWTPVAGAAELPARSGTRIPNPNATNPSPTIQASHAGGSVSAARAPIQDARAWLTTMAIRMPSITEGAPARRNDSGTRAGASASGPLGSRLRPPVPG